MTELPTAAYPTHLSDGSLATDPWPGFDLHPIRSTPEGSPIGGLAEREVEPGGCGETKDSQSKGSLLCIEFPAPCWQKNVRTKACQTSLPGFVIPVCVCVCVCVRACVCVPVHAQRRENQKGERLQVQYPPLANSNSSVLFYKGSKMFPPSSQHQGEEKNSRCNCS